MSPCWYLVKLREDELILYFIGQREKDDSEPAEQIIHLTDGIVNTSSHSGFPTFTLQVKNKHYIFRISVSEHTKAIVDFKKMRDKWVDLLSSFCTHLQSKPEKQDVYACIKEVNKLSYQGAFEQVNPARKNTKYDLLPNSSLYEELSVVPVMPPAHNTHAPPPVPPNTAVLCDMFPLPPPPPIVSKALSSKKMKALHWDQVPQEKITRSIWASCKLGTKKIDTLKILDQFSTTGRTTSTDNPSDSLSCQKILLNHKIAHNFNIVLKSFHIEPSQLRDKLLIIYEQDGRISNEQITTLRRYVPTANDIKTYQSFNGQISDLHIVDQFMLEMCKIPHLSSRLDLLLNARELPVSMKDLYPLISQIVKVCQQLLASQSFVVVLGYILAIGNYLNENAGKEKAKGFRLSTLGKLPQLWGKERKFTLLHALAEQILLHEPDLTKFPLELTEFEAVPGASIKGLLAEVDVIGQQLEKLIEYSKLLKDKAPAQEEPFHKQLKNIIQKYEVKHAQLVKRCEEMKKLYNDVLIKFGESEEQDSQELFGWISSFVMGFNKVLLELGISMPR